MSENTMVIEANALLVGGPSHLWDLCRYVPEDVSRLKLCHGAGYEHFTRTGDTSVVGGRVLTVFSWAASTKVAE
jgi:hypothetical protein